MDLLSEQFLIGLSTGQFLSSAFVLLVIIALLYFFLASPLSNFMKKRQDKIEKGLKLAEKAQQDMESTEQRIKEKLLQVEKEAQKILSDTRTLAKKMQEQEVSKAEKMAIEVIEKAKLDVSNEREQMAQEIRSEIVELIMASTRKITDETFDNDAQSKIISKIASDFLLAQDAKKN